MTFLYRLMQRPKLSMKFRIEPEQKESIKFADNMRQLTLEGKYQGIWIHITNEGKRHVIVAQILRAMGLIPGASDYVCIWKNGQAFIEFKIKPNKQTDSQKDFQNWVEHNGMKYILCYSAEEAIQALRDLGAI